MAKKKSDAPFGARIAKAYTSKGPAAELGRGIADDQLDQEAVVQLPLAMLNRHGLIAGATGTGKTKTIQLLAEQLSRAGIPVFTADMKGDLAGLSEPGVPNDKISERAKELGISWEPAPSPTAFLSLGGIGPGVPVRASIASFGPELLAKVMEANDTQTSSLSLVFRYADEAGLALLDVDDLRAVLQHLNSDEGKADLKQLGGLSSATAGVLLRKIIELEGQGADAFFGEPEFDVMDLMRVVDGQGIISCLELPAVQDKPRMFSTFLMWLLAELFERLPEVGDLDKPKLVFFFDEAHLLFDGASKGFLDQVANTVRLIRSKGVGVFFITQLPDDVPEEVLAQMGNRIQHALRAFTPRDAKALKAAVTTYPKTGDYDLEEDLTRLGIGEAMVTILSEKGAPTPVVWTRMIPPRSLMAAIGDEKVAAAASASDIWVKYSEEIDRESARERLASRVVVGSPGQEGAAPDPVTLPPQPKGSGKKEKNPVTTYLKSREGRQMMTTVARGIFGLLKKR